MICLQIIIGRKQIRIPVSVEIAPGRAQGGTGRIGNHRALKYGKIRIGYRHIACRAPYGYVGNSVAPRFDKKSAHVKLAACSCQSENTGIIGFNRGHNTRSQSAPVLTVPAGDTIHISKQPADIEIASQGNHGMNSGRYIKIMKPESTGKTTLQRGPVETVPSGHIVDAGCTFYSTDMPANIHIRTHHDH